MYTTIVPVDNVNLTRAGREHTVEVLRRAGVNRILLANGAVLYDDTARKENLAVLGDNITYLQAQGFEVGVWMWTYICVNSPFTKITSPDGVACEFGCCPLDPDFLEFRAKALQEIARLHPSLILFDDDMRFSHNGIGIGCACQRHVADIAGRYGRPVSAGEIHAAFAGDPNPLRDAWLDSMGDSVRAFCRRMRQAVDEVDASIRLGQCACISTYDPEGVDSFEVVHLLAGNTKPYLRLTGAPYWAAGISWGNRLADTIELARMQSAWRDPVKDADIEMVSEGDVYPRPRYTVSAAYLECFDTALQADGSFDGIMKYMFDYTMSQRYETGYVERHIQGQPLYRRIGELFGKGQAVGARIYAAQHTARSAILPEKNGEAILENSLFPMSARTAAGCTIPTVYDQVCAGFAFGESARYLPDGALDKGLVLDLTAAKFLTAMGVDVGLRSVGQPLPYGGGICANPNIEYFTHSDEYVNRATGGYEIAVAENAVADSCFTDAHGTPACYFYENAAGQRFCVLAYDLYAACGGASTDMFYRNYTRQEQLIRALAWVGRKPLPAVCPGHPDLYIFCKQDGDRLAVGLWNLSPDRIEAPEVTLASDAADARFVNTAGQVTGNKVTLARLYPFEFAGFEVTLTPATT